MIRYFATHPTAANLLMALFLVIGVLSLPNLQREMFPKHESEEVQITMGYPGATAEEVEESICKRIEEALDGVSNLKEIRSTSTEGSATVVAEMREGGDLQEFLDDIKTEVDAIDDLPDEVENRVIAARNRKDLVVSIAVTGIDDPAQLKSFCEELKEKIKRKSGIAQIDLAGFSDRQLKIKVKRETLLKYGLDANALCAIIKTRSVDIPGGTLETPGRDFLVRVSDRRKSVKDLADLTVLAGAKGAELKLGDIATISDDFEKSEDKLLFNGKRAGMLTFSKNNQDDTLRSCDAILKCLSDEAGFFPAGVKWYLTRDFSSNVRARLDMVISNGIQGFILVFLSLWLFFNFRFSFWVVMGLPVSFLGALALFPYVGLSINMMTMVALLVGTGLLMDDAIVISENIAVHLNRGESSVEAAINGTREVAMGVFASFVTTVCVFAPLAFIAGHIGKIMRVMPIVLTLVLAVSIVEAFLILPHHLGRALKTGGNFHDNPFRRRFNQGFEWFREHTIGGLARLAVDNRYLFMSCVIAVFIASIAMVASGKLKFRLFPDIDGDTIRICLLMPQGTPLDKTAAITERFIAAADKLDREFTPKQPNGQKFVRQVSVQYNNNSKTGDAGANAATVDIDILEAEKRHGRIKDSIAFLRKVVGQVPEAISLSIQDRQPGPGGDPVAIRIRGNNLDELKIVSKLLQAKLSQVPGVFDLTDDLRSGKPELRLRLKAGAAKLGITSQAIASQLGGGIQGAKADDIQVGREEYEVVVYMDDASRTDNLRNLDYFHVMLPSGKRAPLSSLVEIDNARGFSKISNVDGVHTITVSGDLNRSVANSAELNRKIYQEFVPEILKSHPDVSFASEGESKATAETGNSLFQAFLMGILGIFLLLSFQFKSYVDPFFVMLAIPMSLIGVIWGHLAMGLELTMPSAIGFVAISGVVVNDSILLVEFLKMKAVGETGIVEAAKLASKARVRAVLLTSLTTIAGLLPICLERSIQAQTVIPLVVSMASGLMASTLLVLFVIPALYAIKADCAQGIAKFRRHAA